MSIKLFSLTLVLLQFGGLLYASIPACDELCREMHRIVNDAAKDHDLRDDAFQFLVLIAEGRGGSPSAELSSRLSLSGGILSIPSDPDLSIRSTAFRRMGELTTPMVVSYLKKFKREDFLPSDRRILWASVQVGIYTAELEALRTNDEKYQLLDSLLLNDQNPSAPGDVQYWAWNRLCDDGVLGSFPIIKSAIGRYYSDSRSIDESDFCEDRMRSISGQPSRVAALQGILISNTEISERLRRWAIGQLLRMDSEESRKALDSFAKWVDELPVGHQSREELQVLRMNLRMKRLD